MIFTTKKELKERILREVESLEENQLEFLAEQLAKLLIVEPKARHAFWHAVNHKRDNIG